MPPKTPSTPKERGKSRGRSTRARISILKVATGAKTPSEGNVSTDFTTGTNSSVANEETGKFKSFSRAAYSIINMHKLKSEEKKGNVSTRSEKDPWATVMSSVKGSKHSDMGLGLGNKDTSEKRISLAQMLKSREMKNLVQQALVAKQLTRTTTAPGEQSSVMTHWIKLSTLRQKQNKPDDEGLTGESGRNESKNIYNSEEEDDSDIVQDHNGVHSGFDLDDTAKGHQLYGRTLILEESCRRALALDPEQRSQVDLQSLGVWFQTTKLKISTDFERLQPSELDLLCRRMTCVTFHPDETIFRQGDEGDALYIVFSGTVEVRVSQRILGEVVEVTVCELGKGDYFGERSLLNNDVRAATVLSKTPTELVKITRSDYNLMLKNDQLEFLSRMQIANGIGVHRPVQRSQREYIKVLTKKKHTRTKADIDMLSEYLQMLKFFRSLPKSFVRELCVVVDFLTLPAGACVFREGEVGDLFYIIFTGSVDVNINSKDFKGNVQMTKLVNLTEGSHFGELALMKGRGIRSATVITREECQLLVICEKDYNSTLRRMQKKDMSKRVGVLDQIPMFQTPEWTGELLKELSYVLLEQKLSTGSVLYRQGDRASHVYFVVRGELVVTKEIADPFTQVKHEVFVERIGRFRVVGDDAAAGANFNEVIHREVTVSASTPVEVLLLSKYDVFHRLSRSARETLRAAAQSHGESIVYLDRFHKTQKWEVYKKKVLKEHVNQERIEKILPSSAVVRVSRFPNIGAALKSSQIRKPASVKDGKIETDRATEGNTLPVLPIPPVNSTEKRSDTFRSNGSMDNNTARQALVPANELLLITPEAKVMKKRLNPDKTIGDYITSFNVDAPPSLARQRQLDHALKADERRQAEVLKEGNPLAFFDIKVVDKQPGVSWNRSAKLLEGIEQRENEILDKTASSNYTETSSASPPRHPSTVLTSSKNLEITSQALSQLLQENFIFSRPQESKPSSHDARKGKMLMLRTAVQKMSSPRGHSPSKFNTERLPVENFSDSDFVLFAFQAESNEEGPETTKKSPAFQIIQSVRTRVTARETVEHLKSNEVICSNYYIVPLKTFALMPRADRSKAEEDRLQLQQMGEMTSCSTNQRTKSSMEESTTTLQSPTGESLNFSSFQEVTVSPASVTTNNNEPIPLPGSVVDREQSQSTPRRKTFTLSTKNVRHTFAVVSVVLSKLEITNSQFAEPFVAVHALFASEMEAATFAMNLKPSQSLKSAMLCVFPIGKWIHLEHAHDWCVQVEPNKREKRASIVGVTPTSPTQTNQSRSRRQSLEPESPKPIWEQEREEAKRLHTFICARMGLPAVDKTKDRIEESGGFTPQPLISLEDKLDTLHNYLDSTSAFTARTNHGGVAILKYRQVKRFGFIMRSRIAGVLPDGGNNSNSSPSPNSSFANVVPV